MKLVGPGFPSTLLRTSLLSPCSVRYQPVQSFLAGLERRQFPLRKSLHVLIEYFGQAFRSHPSRTLQIRPVEHQSRLKPLQALFVEVCPGEIRQKQHRSPRFRGDPAGTSVANSSNCSAEQPVPSTRRIFFCLWLMKRMRFFIRPPRAAECSKRQSRVRTPVPRLRTGNGNLTTEVNFPTRHPPRHTLRPARHPAPRDPGRRLRRGQVCRRLCRRLSARRDQ